MDILRFGNTGPFVELLQLALNRSGYLASQPDGIFGNQTRAAVLNFQRQFRLAADGIVGPQTWTHLMPYIRGYTTRTIQRGDTFWNLAQRFYTTVRAIGTANPSLNPSALTPGSNIIIPFGFDLIPTNISFTSTVLENVLQGLTVRYPFIASGSIGRSVMGRSIPYIKLGKGTKQVFYNASHHGNEWITTPVLLKYAEEYAKAYSSGGQIYNLSANTLFNTVSLFMAPMVNPDGVDLATGALNPGDTYYQRAQGFARSYPNIPFPTGWKANINGVDLNLNYPANWEKAKEIKFSQGFTKPGPRDYVGPNVLSEPESTAVFNFTQNNDFALILAYHSQGEIIFWRYLDYDPPKAREIGELFAKSSGYELMDTPSSSSYAGYRDWFISNYNRPGYTIEVGTGTNPLPIAQFDKIYRDNRGILTLGMSESLSI
ncbi:MAG: peptidoglycan-binding protein [Oscillospiraceae bacterium]|nr:peptidoglycan-binding protein [Oscillospiraceae bacterium]